VDTRSKAQNGVYSLKFIRNVVVKGLLLFLLVNIGFGLSGSDLRLGRYSAYNLLFPGRERLPFGETPETAFNFSLYDMDAMFASHTMTANQPDSDFRVFVVGDSSIWGTLLLPEETLTGQLNQRNLTVCDSRSVRVFNLGYPTLSLLKDLMIIDQIVDYSPDLVVWMVTLESFPADKQAASPLVEHNSPRIRDLSSDLLQVNFLKDFDYREASFWEQTLIGQRRSLADLIRLQLYGIPWAATGIDQVYPEYEPAQRDLANDQSYYDFTSDTLDRETLSFDLLSAGALLVGAEQFVIINEPILISEGDNSDIRYNFYYPRWAYDQYRTLLSEEASLEDWNYFDFWNHVPEKEFTNSAIHMTPKGTAMLANKLEGIILDSLCQ
jgi:hypothetical protein